MLFTTRVAKRVKVMFSQACVTHSVHWRRGGVDGLVREEVDGLVRGGWPGQGEWLPHNTCPPTTPTPTHPQHPSPTTPAPQQHLSPPQHHPTTTPTPHTNTCPPPTTPPYNTCPPQHPPQYLPPTTPPLSREYGQCAGSTHPTGMQTC